MYEWDVAEGELSVAVADILKQLQVSRCLRVYVVLRCYCNNRSSVLYSRLMRRQGTTNLLTVKILLPLLPMSEICYYL